MVNVDIANKVVKMMGFVDQLRKLSIALWFSDICIGNGNCLGKATRVLELRGTHRLYQNRRGRGRFSRPQHSLLDMHSMILWRAWLATLEDRCKFTTGLSIMRPTVIHEQSRHPSLRLVLDSPEVA